MNVKFNIKLTQTQKKAYKLLHCDDTKYLICNWSRQCGKTVFAEMAIIEYLLQPNNYVGYISPSFSQGRKVYSEVVNLLQNTGLIKKQNGTTLTITTITGSTLQFYSIESPTAIRGNTIKGLLVLDEAAFFPDTLTDGSEPFSSVIMPITKAKKPKILVISTPKGKRGLFYNLYMKAQRAQKGFKALKATIYDDNLVTDDDIDEIKQLINNIAFQEEFLCEFLDSGLTFFKGFEECFAQYEYDIYDKVQAIGIDLSANGDDDTIVTLINSKHQTKVYKVQGTLDQKYIRIANIINSTLNLQKVYIEQNGVGQPMLNEIKKLVKNKNIVYEWQTSNSSKTDIIVQLALYISRKDIQFNVDDKMLWEQLSTFVQKYTKTGKLQFCGISHDDCVMSMAIALQALTDLQQNGTYTIKFGKRKNR